MSVHWRASITYDTAMNHTYKKGIRKVVRFISIYGLPRTVVKVAGRTRKNWLRYFFKAAYLRKEKDVSLIGCGQFGFSTISYFVQKEYGNRFLECYDTDAEHAGSCAGFWGYHNVRDINQLLGNGHCKYVYVASNHASHADYAIQALKAGKHVHIEKPISVTREQLKSLLTVLNDSSGSLYAGYNRPYSKAIQAVDKLIAHSGLPITLGCFIYGHRIGRDHWYRNPQEGTRVCGNIGHWLDLSMHLLNIRGRLPETLRINIMQADEEEADDNLTISYATDYGDLVTITMTSRGEPFEGIREHISIQCGEAMAEIEDFRTLVLQDGTARRKYRYSPKDVGHRRSVMQMFRKDNRDWKEVVCSTLLMLETKKMVEKGIGYEDYAIKDDFQTMMQEIKKS